MKQRVTVADFVKAGVAQPNDGLKIQKGGQTHWASVSSDGKSILVGSHLCMNPAQAHRLLQVPQGSGWSGWFTASGQSLEKLASEIRAKRKPSPNTVKKEETEIKSEIQTVIELLQDIVADL